MKMVAVTGSFDDLGSREIRFLEEAAKRGSVHALLWSDDTVHAVTGTLPKFPQDERAYLLEAIRYVNQVSLVTGPIQPDVLPGIDLVRPDLWLVSESDDTPAKRRQCELAGLRYEVLPDAALEGFPIITPDTHETTPATKKVIVTGCYDWFHSGHVRFFEEVSELGDLYVVVGHDANVLALKGEGHPMFPEDERRYVVQSIRFVKQALVSTGHGWMDAEPEIAVIKPDRYAVNEDGDKPEKQEFCRAHGIEYIVLKRAPKKGLQKRTSTNLRGF